MVIIKCLIIGKQMLFSLQEMTLLNSFLCDSIIGIDKVNHKVIFFFFGGKMDNWS